MVGTRVIVTQKTSSWYQSDRNTKKQVAGTRVIVTQKQVAGTVMTHVVIIRVIIKEITGSWY